MLAVWPLSTMRPFCIHCRRVLALAATAVWVTLVVIYCSKGVKRVHDDWRDPILSPFIALVVIVPTLLAGGLCDATLSVGRVLVAVLSSIIIAVGGWPTVDRERPLRRVHPSGLFAANRDRGSRGFHCGLRSPPSPAGRGLVRGWNGELAADRLHHSEPTLHPTPRRPALTPALVLEAGPPMVAGVAYKALHGGSIDLMATVQVRLASIYRRFSFPPPSGRLRSPPPRSAWPGFNGSKQPDRPGSRPIRRSCLESSPLSSSALPLDPWWHWLTSILSCGCSGVGQTNG
jgi:hypothetical protein